MLRRSQLRRTPFPRRPVSRRRDTIGRPKRLLPLGNGWKQRAQGILERDQFRCRYCWGGPPLQVDHLIPRALAQRDWYNADENLAALCERHHGVKSSRIEPALYRGDVQRFERFLAVIAETGPIPDQDFLGAAYARAAEHLRGRRG